jgi:hypothetical protein
MEFSAELNFKWEKDKFFNCRFNEMQVEEHSKILQHKMNELVNIILNYLKKIIKLITVIFY